MIPRAALISPRVPLISPRVPLISPRVALISPRVPLISPRVPLISPRVPLISRRVALISIRCRTPRVPLISPRGPTSKCTDPTYKYARPTHKYTGRTSKSTGPTSKSQGQLPSTRCMRIRRHGAQGMASHLLAIAVVWVDACRPQRRLQGWTLVAPTVVGAMDPWAELSNRLVDPLGGTLRATACSSTCNRCGLDESNDCGFTHDARCERRPQSPIDSSAAAGRGGLFAPCRQELAAALPRLSREEGAPLRSACPLVQSARHLAVYMGLASIRLAHGSHNERDEQRLVGQEGASRGKQFIHLPWTL